MLTEERIKELNEGWLAGYQNLKKDFVAKCVELAALRATNTKLMQLFEVSKMVLSADYESTGGLLDCKDNNGQCYQSAFLAAALSKMQMIVCQIAEAKTDNL